MREATAALWRAFIICRIPSSERIMSCKASISLSLSLSLTLPLAPPCEDRGCGGERGRGRLGGRETGREGERERDKGMERERERDRGMERERERVRGMERERERVRGMERERERDRVREGGRGCGGPAQAVAPLHSAVAYGCDCGRSHVDAAHLSPGLSRLRGSDRRHGRDFRGRGTHGLSLSGSISLSLSLSLSGLSHGCVTWARLPREKDARARARRETSGPHWTAGRERVNERERIHRGRQRGMPALDCGERE
jgi:hypothetical protein